MLLYRIAPEGFYAVSEEPEGELRMLHSDPLAEPRAGWRLGRRIVRQGRALLPPVRPSKIVGIGRNYVEHAREMETPVPSEPLLFLKAPSSVVGPLAPVVLPLESQRVEYEGEIALVVGERLRRGSPAEAARGPPRGARGRRGGPPGPPRK